MLHPWVCLINHTIMLGISSKIGLNWINFLPDFALYQLYPLPVSNCRKSSELSQFRKTLKLIGKRIFLNSAKTAFKCSCRLHDFSTLVIWWIFEAYWFLQLCARGFSAVWVVSASSLSTKFSVFEYQLALDKSYWNQHANSFLLRKSPTRFLISKYMSSS